MTAKKLQPLERERAKKDVVALTVRLPKAEWERLHRLALSEGVSIQTLAVRGLSLVFAEKGLAAIKA
jgi:uncharacterized membrane protein